MIYRVEISEPAQNDIEEISDYIAPLSIPAAINQVDRLIKRIHSLDFMPERYKLYDREPFEGKGLRMVAVDNYCIFYHVDDEAEMVEISRVVNGRRNFDTLDIDIHWGEKQE
ncbi:MAG: type II toxin-antitoxin system RelE/ParE family toxin [Oscillospiraceae bacterium]|nr:type II toxin-antitoxin system RelE/ParE family toxin [Oscillospiraceae bacterium]